MKQINATPHILEDKIVQDSILAVNRVKEESGKKGFISGGMAVQSYLPYELHRSTVDLDITLLWFGNPSGFRNLILPLKEDLKSKNYEVNFRKRGLTYDLIVSDIEKEDSFIVQHPRWSEKHFKNVKKKSLEREVEHKKSINKKGLCYDVISPEDSSMIKLNRAITFAKKYDLKIPKKNLTDLKKQSDNLISNMVSRFPNVSPSEVALVRLINDCYDIKSISEYQKIDKNYFNEVVRDWRRNENGRIEIYNLLDKLEINH